MIYVAFMTFVLIASSVTMVLAVDAGHQMNKNKVTVYMLLTIIGGIIFVGSQAWEWGHFIHGDKGAIELSNHDIIHIVDQDDKLYSIYDLVGVDSHGDHAHDITMEQVETAFFAKEDFGLKMSDKTIVSKESAAAYFNNSELVFGANLIKNEYGHQLFANFFYFITGFHGFHVFSGIIFNIIVFFFLKSIQIQL